MLPISGVRAIWLVARLKLVRLLHQSALIGQRVQLPGQRRASQGKPRGSWLATVVVLGAMLFAFQLIARQALYNLACQLDGRLACLSGIAGHDPVDANTMLPLSHAVSGGLTLMLGLLCMASVIIQLGNRNVAGQDSDLEWLVTLPMTRRILMLARLAERSVSNAFGWMALTPLCLVIAWHGGYRWSAPLLALALAWPLLLLAAVCWTVIDTGWRLSLGPSRLRNLQALMSVAGTPLLLLTMSFGTASAVTFQFDWARAMPEWTAWTPPGLVVQALHAPQWTTLCASTALLLGEVAVLVWAGLHLLHYQLRYGVVGSGARDNRTISSASALPAISQPTVLARLLRLPLTAVQRREWCLLMRDRNFLAQSLVVPVVLLASQLVLNGHLGSVAGLATQPALLAALAFGLGVQVLLIPAMGSVNREGAALWLLYTFPVSLQTVLKEKAQLWAGLSLVYPCAIFAGCAVWLPTVGWSALWSPLLVILGLPSFAFIAVALGVFAAEPLRQEENPQLKSTYVYLYMLLSATYVFGLFASAWWISLSLVLMMAALAFALWQKAGHHLPYLLEPQLAPPPRVSAADGIVAATLLFAAQGMVVQWAGGETGMLADLVANPVITNPAADALIYLLLRYTFWRAKVPCLPAIGWVRWRQAVRWGCGLGIPVALFCLACNYWLPQGLVSMAPGRHQAALSVPAGWHWAWLGVAVVVPAWCEEFIFRGLIFGELRRALAPWQAILASATLFAAVQPPQSMAPAFLLGVGAALAYQRSGLLLAPILVHLSYGAAMVSLP